MIGRGDIRDWLKECIEDKQKVILSVSLNCYDSEANAIPYDAITPKFTGVWGDAEKMADRFYESAKRRCMGFPGIQQFELCAYYGTNSLWSCLPFYLGSQIGTMPFRLIECQPVSDYPGHLKRRAEMLKALCRVEAEIAKLKADIERT